MIPRKIQAPGVEVNEVDVSQYNGIDLTDSTVVLLNGFSDKGDSNVPKIVTSMNDFTNAYGKPTNEAERYLYNGVKQTLLNGGIPLVGKLSYDNAAMSSYVECAYKVGSKLFSSDMALLLEKYNLDKAITLEGIDSESPIEVKQFDNVPQINLLKTFLRKKCGDLFTDRMDELLNYGDCFKLINDVLSEEE